MEVEDETIVGQCPSCGAEVPYEAWMEVDGEDGVIGCPHCKVATSVDAVFPPAVAT